MHCRTCETALPPGSAFCPKCGTATPSHVSRQEGKHGAALAPSGNASGEILPPPPPPSGTPTQSGSSQYPPYGTPPPPFGPRPQTLSPTADSSRGSSSSLLTS